MIPNGFAEVLKNELKRVDDASVTKRNERVIETFEFPSGRAPRAIINGKQYVLFNANDYLGLRFNEKVKAAEHDASQKYGAGPGGVRFICGTSAVHVELERALAAFHGRDAGMVFSSAFALNLGVLHALLKGQSKDSLVSSNVLVVSDELNHRSIIDGIRVAGLPSEQKAIFKHLNLADLRRVLKENIGKYARAVVITDGIFSMLGECQDLGALQQVADEFSSQYPEGVLTVVDDSHGVAAYGRSGRGAEEATDAKCTLLIGTLGKGFGADGGYVVGDRLVIDYLRESVASYIYSNPVSPGTAGAALAAVTLVDSPDGKKLLEKVHRNVERFMAGASKAGYTFAAASSHPIQPLLIGDAAKTKALVAELAASGYLVTGINYPVVPKGKDEIRVQLSAAHSDEDVDEFLAALAAAGKKLQITA